LNEILVRAGEIAKSLFLEEKNIRVKQDVGDLVTSADEAINRVLVEAINTAYPNDHIHSEEEEHDINPGAAVEWVIDPIDGTRNFASGIAGWCHMIAILRDGILQEAAIYEPLAGIFSYARLGGGAFRNGMRLA